MAEEWIEYDGGAVQERHRSASHIRVASDVAVIPEGAFEDCGNLRAVDLRNVTTLATSAFEKCRSLEHMIWTIASAVEISERAFAYCSSLAEIDLSNATRIGACAFFGCKALTCISVPSSVAEVGESAFRGCDDLVEVELGEGIQRIGKEAFYCCSALVRIYIPASVTDIGMSTFCGCSSLVEVELNEGLQRIESKAFQHCGSLARINIPSTTLKVGNHAFEGCRQLRHAELLEGLELIGWGAFSGCNRLERITIPSSTTIVGGAAFGDCRRLADVTLCEGLQCIYSDPLGIGFNGCTSLAHINIPPVALVIDITGGSCQLLRETMPVPVGRTIKLVVSKWLQHRSPSQLGEAEAKVNEILDGSDLSLAGRPIELIRQWFAYYYLLDATMMLELAIWRCNMGDNEQCAEARKASRQNCGSDMNVIISGVLPFLEGYGPLYAWHSI